MVTEDFKWYGPTRSLEDDIEDIERNFNQLKSENASLRQLLQTFNKNEEIQKSKDEAEYARTHSLLNLSDKELAAISAFKKEHYEKCAYPLHNKAKGNTYLYRLTGVGVGTVIEIQCPICQQWLDVTDTESW